MPGSPRDETTRILDQIRAGTESAGALMPVVYGELRAIAEQMMRKERGNHTLQATALVHEVFVKLVDHEASPIEGHREFLAVAAQAMRNLLVDHARQRRADKRGGNWERVTLAGVSSDSESDLADIEILDLNEALEELEALDPRQARIVELCFFAGMTGDEIAEQLGVHRNTVQRDLRLARAWLRRSMERPSGP